MPIGRGWGTGGLQLTLSLIGKGDTLKVIDQGHDDSVNAVSIKRLVTNCSDVQETVDSTEATVIQSRHRIPEVPLRENQILVLQVPLPEPLRRVEPREKATKKLHAEMDYSSMWLRLYEDIVKWGRITIGADYPCLVNGRYLFNPSPIPRYDVPKLNQAEGLFLFGAGREKRFMRCRRIRMSLRLLLTISRLRLKVFRMLTAVFARAPIPFWTSSMMRLQENALISVQIQPFVNLGWRIGGVFDDNTFERAGTASSGEEFI